MTVTLVDFILARLDEDEAQAFGADLDRYRMQACGDRIVTTVGGGHLRADVEAKRLLIQRISESADDGGVPRYVALGVLLLLALPFAGHPDYDEEWRP